MWQCLSSIRWNPICMTNSVKQLSSYFDFSKLERAQDQMLLVVEACTSKVFAMVQQNPLQINLQLSHLWAPKEAPKLSLFISLMIAPSLVAFQELVLAEFWSIRIHGQVLEAKYERGGDFWIYFAPNEHWKAKIGIWMYTCILTKWSLESECHDVSVKCQHLS